MALYDKKILYLDYLENGKKVKNAGFAKVEVRDGSCRILLNVKGTYDTDSLRTEVILLTDVGEIVTDHFMLNHGTGTYLMQFNPDNMADKGVSYEECLGVGVRLSENRIVQATWRELLIPQEAMMGADTKPQEKEEIPETEIQVEPEPVREAEVITEPESIREAEVIKKSEINEEAEVIAESEPVREAEAVADTETMEKAEETCANPVQETPKAPQKPQKTPQNTVIYDNKWKQLCQMFETVYPFHDERGYLSITPRDFVILTREYQSMVNNSFLLHGFYNYKHIILGREERGKEERYYLGVPGVYYDREKQVAVMFGFESFESETEPAETGGFGYYMKRVNI